MENDEVLSKKDDINKWDDLNLKEEVLRGIYAYGFEIPSDIQKKTILPIMQKKDLIGQAQSGSGKTGAFSISALERIDHTKSNTQVLILSPTHELVKQTAHVVTSLGQYMQGLTVKTLVGGTSVREDIQSLRTNVPHVVVGTIGRIMDMVQRKHLQLGSLELLIIDEADEMLSQGFHEKIKYMFEMFISKVAQIVLFSATVPPDIIHLSKQFMNQPETILMKREELSLKCIPQYFIPVSDDSVKFETLKDIFTRVRSSKVIIYCNSVKNVEDLCYMMKEHNFSVCYIHSNMGKDERKKVFQHFRDGDVRVLISSDLTARGIDIQQVSLVINYDITRNLHTYLHRIGRSGRWGRKGMAINLITRYDVYDMKNIENYYKVSIEQLPIDSIIL